MGVQGPGTNEKYKVYYEDKERQSLDIGNTMCDIMKIQNNMGSEGANRLLGIGECMLCAENTYSSVQE